MIANEFKNGALKTVNIDMSTFGEKHFKVAAVESIRMGTKNTLKYASLVTLTVQNAALSLTMRMSRTQSELFISSTAVIMSEVIKLLTCLVMVRIDEGSLWRMIASIKKNIINNPSDTLKVSVPSIVYYIQNNLIYIGATHLDAATCQVTYQLKILTTALLSVLMLQKRLMPHQWLALLILFVGVAVVQVEQISHKSSSSNAHEQSPIIGFFAILTACCLSGFAGVYFEKILKGSSEVSLWIRNIQLSAIATPFGLIQLMLTDWSVVHEKGFFYGYNFLTWIVILLQAQGGLLVAVVVKYADNILKGFATSLAIVLSCVISVYAFHVQLSLLFVFGASLVIESIFLYGKQVSNKQ
ncbi:UDP-galactose translocator-like protein [Dinothrombium tinctorium]|uniref:UDP-galactose translocator-like protein n=1 Tax=Dinothrombium tinctorium TaxID=1965070 RepID=A0A3S3P334_9ACAR|nr:UDP-galactose translocator-like protein [Dinothrombium tinctorium]